MVRKRYVGLLETMEAEVGVVVVLRRGVGKRREGVESEKGIVMGQPLLVWLSLKTFQLPYIASVFLGDHSWSRLQRKGSNLV